MNLVADVVANVNTITDATTNLEEVANDNNAGSIVDVSDVRSHTDSLGDNLDAIEDDIRGVDTSSISDDIGETMENVDDVESFESWSALSKMIGYGCLNEGIINKLACF